MGFTQGKIELEDFLEGYTQEILDGHAAVFIGAGLSIPCGFPSWNELVEPFANKLGLRLERDTDLSEVVDYYRHNFPHSEIEQFIVKKIDRYCKPSRTHMILASLPIKTYWTTNYDRLIENAFREQGKHIDVKLDESKIITHAPNRSAVLYKMHGDILAPGKIVLARSDYEEYATKHPIFTTVLKNDLLLKSFLFLGFSFYDPNLLNISAQIRQITSKNPRPHYCIYKKVSLKDCNGNKNVLKHAQKREDFRMENMRKYGINFIQIDDYSEIDTIMSSLNRRLHRNFVYISGSAYKYDPYIEDNAESFISALSGSICDNGYRIISGFGLGVGSSVINGALISSEKLGISSTERLFLYPFPQNIKDSTERKNRWTKYRHDMISNAGVFIALFGNKSQNGNIVLADGVMEEFDIAKEKRLLIIPVSQTGYAAEKIWDIVKSDMDSFYETDTIKNEVQKLQKIPYYKTESLVSSIIKIIKLANK